MSTCVKIGVRDSLVLCLYPFPLFIFEKVRSCSHRKVA